MRTGCTLLTLFIGWLTAPVSSAQSSAATPPIQITAADGLLTIATPARALLKYQSTAAPKKPYVAELYTPAGVQVLRDSPADHKHHHGLMFAVGADGTDFWGEASGAGTQQPRDKCAESLGRFQDQPAARLRQTLAWTTDDKRDLLVEQRLVGVVQLANPLPVTLILWQTTLQPADGVPKVTLDGHHYYGLGLRFLQSMDTGGRFFNAAQEPGDVVRGSERLAAAKWSAYTARANDHQVTVAIFDHPRNPRHPNKMFTMTPPFAYMSATLNLWKEPLVVTTGQELKLSYAVAAWDGEIAAEQIETLYQQWRTAK